MKLLKLNACIYDNVGDDLMVDVLLSRYPECKFFYNNPYYQSSDKFLKYSNFINPTKLYRRWGRINYLVNILTFHKYNDVILRWVRNRYERKCTAAVYIGGSIYKEKKNETPEERITREKIKLTNGPLFIIGANFGAYRNPRFKDLFKNYFLECAGVCFRDKESYLQFSDVPGVMYAPDVVFNYSVPEPTKSTDLVAISVVDFYSREELSEYAENYDRFICNVCDQCIKQNRTPVLMAFCQYEGDNKAVERIYDSLDTEIKSKTKKAFYNNIDDIINTINSAGFVLATRFHGMILALKMKKPFFCISYDPKIKNVLDDINSTHYCMPEQLSEIDIVKMLSDEAVIPNLDEYIKKAEYQFKQLDDFLRNMQNRP